MTENPRGFSRSDASLARNLLAPRPTDAVMPTSRSIRDIISARVAAAGRSRARASGDRSRYASSRDTGSTIGVAARKISRIRPLTRLYFAMSGGITTAPGHSSSALNMGMAERGPYRRAM